MVRISLAPIRWKDSIELLQISVGCAKIRYIIKNIGYEEEEYAAGDGSERDSIGWENLASCRGRSLRSCFVWELFQWFLCGRGNGVMF